MPDAAPKPDLAVTIHIRRPPHEVRAWWWDMPDEYVASDPKEQPHRIVTRSKSDAHRDMLTYWRGPLGREVLVPERMRMDAQGDWSIAIELPFGLSQRDEFVLHPTADGTRVEIAVFLWPRRWFGRLALPLYLPYARRSYPATWRRAARICERDAPHIRLGDA